MICVQLCLNAGMRGAFSRFSVENASLADGDAKLPMVRISSPAAIDETASKEIANSDFKFISKVECSCDYLTMVL